jgi:CBS domain-containing protein
MAKEAAMSARVKGTDEPRVREIMRHDAVTVGPQVTVQELADLLRAHDIRSVPVVDQGRLVGVVTEGDIVAQDADLHFPHYIQFLDSLIYLESTKKFEERLRKVVGASVREIMTAEAITTAPDDTVSHAATLMSENRINLLPVVEESKLVGIVTRHEIVASMGL